MRSCYPRKLWSHLRFLGTLRECTKQSGRLGAMPPLHTPLKNPNNSWSAGFFLGCFCYHWLNGIWKVPHNVWQDHLANWRWIFHFYLVLLKCGMMNSKCFLSFWIWSPLLSVWGAFKKTGWLTSIWDCITLCCTECSPFFESLWNNQYSGMG